MTSIARCGKVINKKHKGDEIIQTLVEEMDSEEFNENMESLDFNIEEVEDYDEEINYL